MSGAASKAATASSPRFSIAASSTPRSNRSKKRTRSCAREVAAAELRATSIDKAYGDVEKKLADLQAQVLKHREELTFYRGIVSPEDGIGGLRIQRFQVLPGGVDNHYRLRLVLVQSMRQDAVVSGSVSIQIEGMRGNKPVQLTLRGCGRRNAQPMGRCRFQFRYFQNLEQTIVLPSGFEPKRGER